MNKKEEQITLKQMDNSFSKSNVCSENQFAGFRANFPVFNQNSKTVVYKN